MTELNPHRSLVCNYQQLHVLHILAHVPFFLKTEYVNDNLVVVCVDLGFVLCPVPTHPGAPRRHHSMDEVVKPLLALLVATVMRAATSG